MMFEAGATFLVCIQLALNTVEYSRKFPWAPQYPFKKNWPQVQNHIIFKTVIQGDTGQLGLGEDTVEQTCPALVSSISVSTNSFLVFRILGLKVLLIFINWNKIHNISNN